MARKAQTAVERCKNQLVPLLDKMTIHLLVEKGFDPKQYTSDPKIAQLLAHVANRIYPSVRALFEIHSVIEDVALIHSMSGSFSSRNKTINKSKYLHILWFAFENECYVFKEKIKPFHNKSSNLHRIFDNNSTNNLPGLLKKIDKKLGTHIRSRGTSVHEFNNYHTYINFFEMIEIINKAGAQLPAPGFGDVKGHHSDVKYIVKKDIFRGLDFMCGIFNEEISKEMDLLSSRIEWINTTCQGLRERGLN